MRKKEHEGKELFNEHAAQWLSEQGLPPNADPLELAVSIGRQQILRDVGTGIIPSHVRSFSELHDYVDANGYGNAFDWPCLPSETEDDAYQCAFAEFWNKVQDTLNDWLATGQMRNDLKINPKNHTNGRLR